MPDLKLLDATTLITLVPVSVLTGLCMLAVFGRTSNQGAIRKARKRMKAHMLALRLFSDEPSQVWDANRKLLAANARYLSLMLLPVLVLTVPMLVLFANLDAVYGRAPLRLAEAAIVTVQFPRPFTASDPAPRLETPGGITVETPAVRIPGERQVTWRVRPRTEVDGVLRIVSKDGAVEKNIVAGGSGLHYLAARRVSGWFNWLWHPGERMTDPAIADWVEIQYPAAEVSAFGIQMHWLIWLTIVSMATALLLKKRLGVSF